MTGFQRPGRSYYLDDMNVVAGDYVKCKCACGQYAFTPGQEYKVYFGGILMNDLGVFVVPSARFTYV